MERIWVYDNLLGSGETNKNSLSSEWVVFDTV